MLIKRKRSWELPESAATPESAYLNRRQLMKGAAGGTILAASSLAASSLIANPLLAQEADPSAKLYPLKRNDAYKLDRPVTQERLATTYNNFYEYGTDKSIVSDARKLQIRPWMVKIDGMVEKEMEIGIDDLLVRMPLEERLYRHRCVETWSMAVPWSGFALKSLVEMAKPQSGAKYLQMQTFKDARMAPGQRDFLYPWPYTEGLTMAEANHDLAFIATGIYGKPMPKQNGAPLRLAVPWKYGFKSVKSIVRFTFTDKRPKSFWEGLQASEYGFWANVNPQVAHPRWSQATEKPLGSDERVPTLLYNGYAEQVADLYKDLKGERLFM
ncbi:MAG: mononuclear molybdenum enzyme YedY [Alphaproteobacteria bacterium]|nr:mononuclear molybdenum enzyme YedY [Alphaproteobacteria bacterium]